MKFKILSILLFVSSAVSAQLHQPFADTTASWTITEGFFGDVFDPDTYGSYRLYTYGDTIISSTDYRKLYLSYDLFPTDTVGGSIVGYYRINGNQVFYRQDPAAQSLGLLSTSFYQPNQEVLLYDFGLQPGDTFVLDTTQGSSYPSELILQLIDTVQISGELVRRFQFAGYNVSFWPQGIYLDYSWLQGIGSDMGFFPDYYILENAIYFNCFHENNIDYVFYMQAQDNCTHLTMGVPKIENNTLYIFPNPSRGEFKIESNEYYPDAFISDMVGRKILNLNIENGINHVDLSMLSTGIYILNCRSVKKTISIAR